MYFFSVNLTSKALSPGRVWYDTGCARGLGGPSPHPELAPDLPPIHSPSPYTAWIEVRLNQAVAQSDYLNALSKAVLGNREADLRMGRHDITVNQFRVNSSFTDDTAPVIDITDI